MEVVQGNLELLERIFGDDVAARNIAKFKKRGERLDNLRRDESLNRIHIDLSFETRWRGLDNITNICFVPSSTPSSRLLSID